MKLKLTSIELKTQRSCINSLITNTLIKTSVLLLNKPFLTNGALVHPYNRGLALKCLPSKSFNPSFNSLPFSKTKFKYPLQVFVFSSEASVNNLPSVFTNLKSIALVLWGVSFSSCFFLISKKIQIESFISPLYVYQTFSCLLAYK
jgi:hypothetical protein